MQTLLSLLQSNSSGCHVNFATSDELLALIRAKDATNILPTLHLHSFDIYHTEQDLISAIHSIDWNVTQILFVKEYGAFIVENDKAISNALAVNLLERVKNYIDFHVSLACGECEGKSDPATINSIIASIESYYERNFFSLIIDSPRGQFFTILPNLASLITDKCISLENDFIIPPPLIVTGALSHCLDHYCSFYEIPPRYIIVHGVGIIILGDNEQHARQIGKAVKREITLILTAEQLGGIA